MDGGKNEDGTVPGGAELVAVPPVLANPPLAGFPTPLLPLLPDSGGTEAGILVKTGLEIVVGVSIMVGGIVVGGTVPPFPPPRPALPPGVG
jgi:hypothetical protein